MTDLMGQALAGGRSRTVIPGNPLLLDALRDPWCCSRWSLGQWDLCIRQAVRCDLVARLGVTLEQAGVLDAVPGAPRWHLDAARTLVGKHVRDVDFELTLLHEALAPLATPVVLLKGAAYRAAALPFAATRLFSDIDILVRRDMLRKVEAALFARGWVQAPMDAYDRNYYREFMHEVPPMMHTVRGTTVDIHHTILPPTSPGSPDPEQLLEASLATGGPFRVLGHEDMLLHSATHLFHEGEFEHGFRDLLDLKDLLDAFAQEEGFMHRLDERARRFGLQRPVDYARRYTGQVFGPQPGAAGTSGVMDALFHRALAPWHPSCDDGWTALARFALYLRGHYLRMPPRLLIPHLMRKLLKRLAARPPDGPM